MILHTFLEYYRNYAQIPKNGIKKSHTILGRHEFLNLYGKRWPKFKKVSKNSTDPSDVGTLCF